MNFDEVPAEGTRARAPEARPWLALWACLAFACGGSPAPTVATSERTPGPVRLRLDVPLADRIADEDITVMRFVDGPVVSVPPEGRFVVPGRTYVVEELPGGDYTLTLRAACPDCAVDPHCRGFELHGDDGPGPWGGCTDNYAFTVADGETLRFTVSERDSPSGPSALPRSLCGDYVLTLHAGLPSCLDAAPVHEP